ncbi:MAG TPA: cation transporter [Candidatus Aquirickettsiella sp.]|jgi:divalent metal cation (Fe/Co/Zn/Cd) transporter
MSVTKNITLLQEKNIKNINTSKKFLWMNIIVYLLISIIEYYLSIVSQSQMLKSDALNNLSGILSTGLLLIGLYIATGKKEEVLGKPTADRERSQISRLKFETIFTLIAGIIMIGIALSIITSSIKSLMV